MGHSFRSSGVAFYLSSPTFWVWIFFQSSAVIAISLADNALIIVCTLATLAIGSSILLNPRLSLLSVSIITFMIHPDVISKEFVVSALGVNWYAMDWILLFSFLSIVLSFFMGGIRRIPKSALALPVVFFLVLLPLSAYVGIQHGNSVRDVFADLRLFFYYVSFFMVLAFVKSQRDLEWIFWGTIVCGIVGAIPEIVGSLAATQVDSLTGQRLPFVRITGWHEVNYPVQLVGSIAMLPFVRLLRARFLLVVSILVSSIALLLSYARGSWLAAGFGLAMLLVSMLRFAPNLRKTLGIVVAAGISAFFIFALLVWMEIVSLEAFSARATLVSSQTIDISSLARVSEWKEAIDVFQKNPILGAGLGYIFHFYAVGIGEVQQIFIHNSYIYVLSKMGLLGFIAFLSIFLTALVMGYQSLKRANWGIGMGLILSFNAMLFVLMVKSLTTWHLNTITSSLFVGVILGAIAVAHSFSTNGNQ